MERPRFIMDKDWIVGGWSFSLSIMSHSGDLRIGFCFYHLLFALLVPRGGDKIAKIANILRGRKPRQPY